MNKKKSLKAAGIIAVVIIVLVAGFGGWYFMAGSNAYQDVFYPGTTLNKMDIEGLTVDQAREKLEDSVKDYSLTISFKNAQCRISGQDIQMACNDKADIQALKDQQNKVRYNKTDKDALALTVKDLFTYDREALTNQLKQCDALDEEKMIEPENAVLVYDEEKNSFSLKNGEQGTKMIFSEVLAAAEEALEENLSELDAADAGLYQTAALTEESPKAADVLKEADDYLKLHLEYTFSKDGKDKKEIIDSKLVSEWLYVDDNGDVQADHDQIQAWVNDMADEYNSDKVSMQFTTTSGSEISLKVPVGGEAIDTSALFKDVVKCLEDKVSGDRKVPHTEKASGISQNFGGNYVEVNLTDQKLYLYKKGELIMSSNIVSGSVSKSHMTPTGVYQVYSMEKNTVLRGADYASPVSFWMPFNGGVGFHDATWRSSFGGTIYQYNGSHGCINMPYDKAKTLYENINTGYYVVVYGGVTYVPGQTTDRGSSSGSSSSGHKKNDRDDRKDDTKKETKKESDKETKKETKETEKHTETKKPETTAPETKKPETSAPETSQTETKAPETSAPDTKAPETNPPETSAPEPQPEPQPEPEAPEEGLVDAQSVSGI